MIAEERVLVLADLDGRTAELRDQDLVAGLDGGSNALAIAVEGTGANGKDLGLVELLDGRLGKEDTAGSLGLGLDALDQDAVEQGSEGLDGLGGNGGLWIVLAAWFAHGVVRQQVRYTILTVIACDKLDSGKKCRFRNAMSWLMYCCRWKIPEATALSIHLGRGFTRSKLLYPELFRTSVFS